MPSLPREVLGDLAAVAFVEANLLFRSLDAEARADLLALARVEDYEAGELIAADAGDELVYLVREGRAAVLLDRAGTAAEAAVLEKGAVFGEGRVLGSPVVGALVARTEVSVVTLPAPVVSALAARFPKLLRLLETVKAARERDAAHRLGG
ncbi:MAG: cyclic nucleotide-binding domain-containing protein [Anaeromyxobacter sp.]|nr:cyclic nucleotide-binding domain-containing protein [Anaeromyxobacter sp.]